MWCAGRGKFRPVRFRRDGEMVDTVATRLAAVVGEALPPMEQGAEDSYNMLPA